MRTILVQDVMSSPPIWVSPSATMQQASSRMDERGFRRLPVIDRGRLVGIVINGDIREASAILQATTNPFDPERANPEHFLVGEVMSTEVITARIDTSILDVAKAMREHKIGAVPILDLEENLVGIVTESDIFDLFIQEHNDSTG